MSVLVTGGTGKTGRRLIDLLRTKEVEAHAASRYSHGGRYFDWHTPASWNAALEGVTAAYLVAPPGDSAAAVIDFCIHAQERGVRRFVLLSASLLSAGGPAQGKVHEWLAANVAEWGVLRPSWFMQNFSEGPHAATIRAEDCIYSAAESGRVGFISADDIAASAAAMLTSVDAPNTDAVLTGPQAISYDTAAATLSETLGRSIRHVGIDAEDLAARHRAAGMLPIAAQILAGMDVLIARGAEDRTTDGVESFTGVKPIAFGDFCHASVKAWERQ